MTKRKKRDTVRLEDYPLAVESISMILSRKGIAEVKIGKYGLMVSEVKKKTIYDQKPQ